MSSAYLGGAYDIVVQRIVDAWMSFPALVIVLSLLAVLGPGLLNLILALSILGAAGASRVIRGATLSTMQNPYVEAARALGAGHLRVVLRHLLPNVQATIIILATIGLGTVILAESALSFLGFGVPAALPVVGRHALGLGALVHVSRAVDGALAGRGDLARRLRLQHARRRAARRARPAAARRGRPTRRLTRKGQRRAPLPPAMLPAAEAV